MYDVAYAVVGPTYDVVGQDARHRRCPTTSHVARIKMPDRLAHARIVLVQAQAVRRPRCRRAIDLESRFEPKSRLGKLEHGESAVTSYHRQ